MLGSHCYTQNCTQEQQGTDHEKPLLMPLALASIIALAIQQHRYGIATTPGPAEPQAEPYDWAFRTEVSSTFKGLVSLAGFSGPFLALVRRHSLLRYVRRLRPSEPLVNLRWVKIVRIA